jgi:hypothetical protein
MSTAAKPPVEPDPASDTDDSTDAAVSAAADRAADLASSPVATGSAAAAVAAATTSNNADDAAAQAISIDIVEKSVFAVKRLEDESGEEFLEEDVENHPLLDDGLLLVLRKPTSTGRLIEGRRFVWVDAEGLHWVNAPRKPAIGSARQGKVLPLHDIDHITATDEAAKQAAGAKAALANAKQKQKQQQEQELSQASSSGASSSSSSYVDPFAFTVHSLDKSTLTFKVDTPRGRTTDQAEKIAAFLVRSLQKLINSLNSVGRLVNCTEPPVLLTPAQLVLRRKLERSGVLLVRKLATKPYFKWFYRIFLEDGVLYWVKHCLLTAVASKRAVEALYEKDHYLQEEEEEEEQQTPEEMAAALQRRAKRQERREKQAASREARRAAAARAAAGRRAAGRGSDEEEDDESDYHDGDDDDNTTASSALQQSEGDDDVAGKKMADDIDTAQLLCATRDAPALFHLATATRGFKECPVLPKTDKQLRCVVGGWVRGPCLWVAVGRWLWVAVGGELGVISFRCVMVDRECMRRRRFRLVVAVAAAGRIGGMLPQVYQHRCCMLLLCSLSLLLLAVVLVAAAAAVVLVVPLLLSLSLFVVVAVAGCQH